MSDSDRIERLETIVRSLNQQMVELRGEVAALGGGRAPSEASARAAPALSRPGPARRAFAEPATAPTPPAKPAPRAARGGVAALDLEELVGRYGTIALATLALLAGMGTFLTWAIAHGLLGPTQRVVLGAIGAAVVAAAGWRLRSRGTVRFGNIILALALALLHLDLWAAGPRLHVIPPVLALVVTAVASVVLAALALRTPDEPLFCVGLGGALAAPFVVSTSGGSASMLAGYGWIVIAGGLAVISTRSWRFAIFMIGAACAVYAAASHELIHAGAPWMERAVPTLFALACAGSALAWGVREVRTRLALGFLVVATTALFFARLGAGREAATVALGLAGTITGVVALRAGFAPPWWRRVGAAILPLGFLTAALRGLAHPDTLGGAAVALLWVAVALLAAWRDDENRDLHFANTVATSAVAVYLSLSHHPEWCVAALAVHASLASVLMHQRRAPVVAVPIALVLVIASEWSVVILGSRTAYEYVPFFTAASVAALATVLGWWVFSRRVPRLSTIDLSALAMVPPLAAFVWVRQELAFAYSADIAVFLLIVFYALAGIGAIFYGRSRSLAAARATGLALACYAAVKALFHAWGLSAIGLRVGACILAGAFIALVAYWYRDGREQGGSTGFRGQGSGFGNYQEAGSREQKAGNGS